MKTYVNGDNVTITTMDEEEVSAVVKCAEPELRHYHCRAVDDPTCSYIVGLDLREDSYCQKDNYTYADKHGTESKAKPLGNFKYCRHCLDRVQCSESNWACTFDKDGYVCDNLNLLERHNDGFDETLDPTRADIVEQVKQEIFEDKARRFTGLDGCKLSDTQSDHFDYCCYCLYREECREKNWTPEFHRDKLMCDFFGVKLYKEINGNSYRAKDLREWHEARIHRQFVYDSFNKALAEGVTFEVLQPDEEQLCQRCGKQPMRHYTNISEELCHACYVSADPEEKSDSLGYGRKLKADAQADRSNRGATLPTQGREVEALPVCGVKKALHVKGKWGVEDKILQLEIVIGGVAQRDVHLPAKSVELLRDLCADWLEQYENRE